MSDTPEKLHNALIKSELFKGRSDWYFCFLKAEKIANVLLLLSQKQSQTSWFEKVCSAAEALYEDIILFAQGEVASGGVEGDILTLLASVRMAQTAGVIEVTTAKIILKEIEDLFLRFSASAHAPSLLSREDFSVEDVPAGVEGLLMQKSPLSAHAVLKGGFPVKDIHKGHSTDTIKQSDRMAKVLDFVKKNKGVSIKDISAVVRGCSEKTIQRELASLITQGLVRKVGERRWSQYLGV